MALATAYHLPVVPHARVHLVVASINISLIGFSARRIEPARFRKGFSAFVFTAGCSLLAMHTAHALNGPINIQIEGGPLGTLERSGGASGYFYGQTGTSNSGTPSGSFLGDSASGANLGAALIELQKTRGILQFNIEVGPAGGTPTLGAKPAKAGVTL